MTATFYSPVQRVVLVLTALLLLTGSFSPATAAGTDPTPAYPGWVGGVAALYGSGTVAILGVAILDAEPDTTATLTVFDCDDQPVRTATEKGTGDFGVQVDFFTRDGLIPLPGRVHYRVVLSAPGVEAPYQVDRIFRQRRPAAADRNCNRQPEPKTSVSAVRAEALPGGLRLVYRATRLERDVTVTQRVIGCDNKVVARKRISGRTGTYQYGVTVARRQLPRYMKVLTVIEQPGRETTQQRDLWMPRGHHCG